MALPKDGWWARVVRRPASLSASRDLRQRDKVGPAWSHRRRARPIAEELGGRFGIPLAVLEQPSPVGLARDEPLRSEGLEGQRDGRPASPDQAAERFMR